MIHGCALFIRIIFCIVRFAQRLIAILIFNFNRVSWYKGVIFSTMTGLESWVFTARPFPMKIFNTNIVSQECCRQQIRGPTPTGANSLSQLGRPVRNQGGESAPSLYHKHVRITVVSFSCTKSTDWLDGKHGKPFFWRILFSFTSSGIFELTGVVVSWLVVFGTVLDASSMMTVRKCEAVPVNGSAPRMPLKIVDCGEL